MDIASLEKFLQERIKVGGKAGALGDSVVVTREKSKITVTSDSNFSKRYLKYLTKKYLKKHNVRDWLRVISSNKDRNRHAINFKLYNRCEVSRRSSLTMQHLTKLLSTAHPTLNFAHPALESLTWNTIIRAQVLATSPAHKPISVYFRMRFHGIEPYFRTFPFLLQSFNSPPHLQSGQQIHAQIHLFGLACDTFVQTSLINMYSSCGDLGSARQVFDEIGHPDLPSWNSIITSFIREGQVSIARELFDLMPERNVISWSSMINGYVRSGEYREALLLFRQMQMVSVSGVRPNEFTMSSVLSACGRLGRVL
ncbi:hypothetical protein Tsubulata_043920, partial [Turnera subulata]